MSRRILDRVKFGSGDLNPHIGTVSIPGNPPRHPGASCCFVCFVVLLGNPSPDRHPAEPFTRHSCFILLRPIIPPGIDHSAVSHCATHRAGRTRNLEAPEPFSELPVGVRRRRRMRGSANESRKYYQGRSHRTSDQGTPVSLALRRGAKHSSWSERMNRRRNPNETAPKSSEIAMWRAEQVPVSIAGFARCAVPGERHGHRAYGGDLKLRGICSGP